MSLRDRLHDEMTAAMRSGDALRRDTLRMVWSAVYSAEKRDRTTLTDDEALAVLSREVKTRRESVEAYRTGGREDLAAKEEAEIAIISELPAPGADRGRARRARRRGDRRDRRVVGARPRARSWAG